MKILSFAADEETIKKIERFKEKYKGRSEIIRSSVQALTEKEDQQDKLQGFVDAILLVNHPEKHTQALMEARHVFQELIQTHLHTHLENHHCLELFILKGHAHKIKKITDYYQTSKKVSNVKLIVS